MIIIQGSNTPITITFDESTEDFTYFHALLVSESGEELKHWKLNEITKDDEYTISCPLTQDETVSFPEGCSIFEVKWMEDNTVQFAKQVKCIIAPRYDHHILGDSNENS